MEENRRTLVFSRSERHNGQTDTLDFMAFEDPISFCYDFEAAFLKVASQIIWQTRFRKMSLNFVR